MTWTPVLLGGDGEAMSSPPRGDSEGEKKPKAPVLGQAPETRIPVQGTEKEELPEETEGEGEAGQEGEEPSIPHPRSCGERWSLSYTSGLVRHGGKGAGRSDPPQGAPGWEDGEPHFPGPLHMQPRWLQKPKQPLKKATVAATGGKGTDTGESAQKGRSGSLRAPGWIAACAQHLL